MGMKNISRRGFLTAATVAALGAQSTAIAGKKRKAPRRISPNEKLNIATIGVGGMGKANTKKCRDENIVALCDVDDVYAGETFAAYPKAKRFRDYRTMFDQMGKEIDAVIIATPDHSHAVIATLAMRLGKHVYCQKPLAHNIHEVRALVETARACRVQTQLGNQGHSANGMRRLREWIEDGAIGPVREVHAWTDRPAGGDIWTDFPIMKRPAETPPVPDTLDWDLWIGPARQRPYHPIYHPIKWRGWCDFGTGPLGDIGCHVLDPSFFALDLGAPEWVEATSTHWEKEVSDETYPRASVVRFQFPARGDKPPVRVTWYDGRLKPCIPDDFDPRMRLDATAAFLIGDQGTISHGFYGAQDMRLLPKERALDYKQPPETLPRVKDEAHELDWVRACKDGKPSSANFDYAGPLNEMLLLGVIATRCKDRRLNWDSQAMQFTNDDKANAFINPPYREGWSL